MNRPETVSALRRLADLLESNECFDSCNMTMPSVHSCAKEHIRLAVRAFGALKKQESWDKTTLFFNTPFTSDYTCVSFFPKGRDQVCRKVVTKKLVPEQVVPATPERVVPESIIPGTPERVIPAHEEEVVEWDCDPIMAPDPDANMVAPPAGVTP